jgi:uncharacterized protein (DUF3084 family)
LNEITPQLFLAAITLVLAIAAWVNSRAGINKATGKREETETQIIQAQSTAAIEVQRMINKMVGDFMNELSIVRSELAAVSRDYTQLRVDFAKVSTQNDQRGTELEKLEVRIADAERARQKANEDKDALYTKAGMVDLLRGQVLELKKSVDALGQKHEESMRRELALQVKNDTLAARNLKADEDKLILKNQVIELEEKVQRMQLRIAELEALVQNSDYLPVIDEATEGTQTEGDNAANEAALVNTGEES